MTDITIELKPSTPTAIDYYNQLSALRTLLPTWLEIEEQAYDRHIVDTMDRWYPKASETQDMICGPSVEFQSCVHRDDGRTWTTG
jgi:hypothetical protein